MTRAIRIQGNHFRSQTSRPTVTQSFKKRHSKLFKSVASAVPSAQPNEMDEFMVMPRQTEFSPGTAPYENFMDLKEPSEESEEDFFK